MHDVAYEFARAAVRSKDAQKQLARTSLTVKCTNPTLAPGNTDIKDRWKKINFKVMLSAGN